MGTCLPQRFIDSCQDQFHRRQFGGVVNAPLMSHAKAENSFPSTSWTLISRLADPHERQSALDQLCAHYWKPVYAYLCVRFSAADAEDITQEFLLTACRNGLFEKADPEAGRLRAWLCSSLRLFLANRHRVLNAAKRGGEHKTVQIEVDASTSAAIEIADGSESPDEAFERAWLAEILRMSVETLREQYRAAGQEAAFSLLLPFLAMEPDANSQLAAASRLEISVSTFRVQLHRLRRRYADEIRKQVAQTISNSQDLDEELQHLFEIAKRK